MNESRFEEQLLQEALAAQAVKDASVKDTRVDTEKSPVREDLARPENVDIPIEVAVEPVQDTSVQVASNGPQESWKYMREELERARYEKEQARREKEELIRYMQQAQETQKAPVQEEEYQAPQDEFIEGKQLNQSNQAIKLKIDRERKAREELEKRMNVMMAEQQLINSYPDYKKVLSSENLEKLEKLKPSLARSILANTDPLSAREATYDAIKAFVLPMQDQTFKENEVKAQNERLAKNLTRPMPSTNGQNSPTNTPLKNANVFAGGLLTNERKDEIYADWLKASGGNYYNFKK